MFDCTLDQMDTMSPDNGLTYPDTITYLHALYTESLTHRDVCAYGDDTEMTEDIHSTATVVIRNTKKVTIDTVEADRLIVMNVQSLNIKHLKARTLIVGKTRRVDIARLEVHHGFVQSSEILLGHTTIGDTLRTYGKDAAYTAIDGEGILFSFVPKTMRPGQSGSKHIFQSKCGQYPLLDWSLTSFSVQEDIYHQLTYLDQVQNEEEATYTTCLSMCNELIRAAGGSRYTVAEAETNSRMSALRTAAKIAAYFEEKVFPTDTMMDVDAPLSDKCISVPHPTQSRATTVASRVPFTGTFDTISVPQNPQNTGSGRDFSSSCMQTSVPIVVPAPVDPIQVPPVMSPVTPVIQKAPVDVYSEDALMINGEKKSPEVEEMLQGARIMKEKAEVEQATIAAAEAEHAAQLQKENEKKPRR